MEKILTIAIPVYNMEQYLHRCLDSVVSSRCIEHLEILVVNDGSKDNSLAIAREYEARFPESVRAIDKPNGGWGSAINLSIREAKGKYYKPLDSDDWFNTDELDRLVEAMIGNDADVIISAVTEVCDDVVLKKKLFTELLGSGRISISQYMQRNGYSTPAPIHCIAYRTEMLREHGFKVSECFYADLDFLLLPLIYSKTLYVTDCNVYNYFLGREGQSISVIGYRKHFQDYLRVCRNQIDFYEQSKHRLDVDSLRLMKNKLFDHIKWGYELMLSPRYCLNQPRALESLREFDSNLKETSPEIYALTSAIKTIKIIPYVSIWRATGINILKLTVRTK